MFTFGFTFMFGCSRAAVPREQAPAAAHGWEITDAGVGPVRLGMTRSELAAAAGTPLRSGSACDFVKPPAAPAGVLVMLVNDVVRRVDVTSANLATPAGVAVGSTEAAALRAYPSARVEPHKYTSGHYLTVDLSQRGTRLLFETDGMVVTRYRVGLVPEVNWVEGCG